MPFNRKLRRHRGFVPALQSSFNLLLPIHTYTCTLSKAASLIYLIRRYHLIPSFLLPGVCASLVAISAMYLMLE